MESPDYAPVPMDSSRPSLGFPLGTALLLIVLFTLSGVFSCCYHWDKLRSLRRRSHSFSDTDLEADHPPSPPTKPVPPHTSSKAKQSQSLPVVMPGDRIAKFIALPSPCEPPRLDKLLLQVEQKQHPKPLLPRIAVPLYYN